MNPHEAVMFSLSCVVRISLHLENKVVHSFKLIKTVLARARSSKHVQYIFSGLSSVVLAFFLCGFQYDEGFFF